MGKGTQISAGPSLCRKNTRRKHGREAWSATRDPVGERKKTDNVLPIPLQIF